MTTYNAVHPTQINEKSWVYAGVVFLAIVPLHGSNERFLYNMQAERKLQSNTYLFDLITLLCMRRIQPSKILQ